MKKKLWIAICVISVLAISLVLVACGDSKEAEPNGNQPTTDAIDYLSFYTVITGFGYTGTQQDLIADFEGDNAYALAVAKGYRGTSQEWLYLLIGVSAHNGAVTSVGDNHHWFVGVVDTGVVAEDDPTDTQGEDDLSTTIVSVIKSSSTGDTTVFTINYEDGSTSTFDVFNDSGDSTDITLDEEHNWVINGTATNIPAHGATLATPYLGQNDNWWIGDIDTGLTVMRTRSFLEFYPLDDGTWGVMAGKASQLSSIIIPYTYNGQRVTSILDNAFKDAPNLKEIYIPSSVTSIGASAFENCSKLSAITLPDGVTSIGKSAFSGCSKLTSITIPEGVTSIGEYAFRGCSGLTSVTIPDSVTSIGDWAFRGCSGLTSVTIPDSVTSIGDWAFSGCSGLTSITIPDSVTSIGYGALVGCRKMTSITYQGTKAQWNAISKGSA